MINKLAVMLVLMAVHASQVTVGQDITASQADSMRLVLGKALPDTSRLEILFRLVEFYIVKPGVYKEDLDTATVFLENAALINAKASSEDTRGFYLLVSSLLAKEQKHEKQAKEMAENAVRILGNSKNNYYAGRAYFNLSDYYHYSVRSELVEQIRLVELAVKSFSKSKYTETYAYSLKHLADLYEINEQRPKVLENLNLSLNLYKSIPGAKLYGVYIVFSRYYFLGGNYKLALDYGLMALKDAESAGDYTMSYCQINNYLAITQVRLKERERAIDYYNTALHIAEKYKDHASILMLMNNMVQNYIELRNPQAALRLMKNLEGNLFAPDSDEGHVLIALNNARIYFELKKFSRAELYCNQLIELIRVHTPRAQVVNDVYQVLIKFYLATGQYSLAKTFHHKIDSLSRKMGDPARIKENFYLAFRLDTASAAYRSAIDNLLKFQYLNDSLFDETNTRQMQQLEVEYETQKAKTDLSIRNQDNILLHQENQLQQGRLDKASLIRKFTTGGLLLLLIIIVLLWLQFRQKQKSSDIISGKNVLLQGLVTEKEWLLKETHHRVKNNLQVVMSLLNSQSAYVENGPALKAIRDCQHRVHAMSLIHQKLYNTDNLSSIDISFYISELLAYLRDSFNTGHRILIECNIEPLELGERQAVPLGLIINEAVTNAIKYAFPANSRGVINISLFSTVSDEYSLVIADNGIGITHGIAGKKRDSLGMTLMSGLSKELEGLLTVEANNGTVVTLLFQYDRVTEDRDALIGSLV